MLPAPYGVVFVPFLSVNLLQRIFLPGTHHIFQRYEYFIDQSENTRYLLEF